MSFRMWWSRRARLLSGVTIAIASLSLYSAPGDAKPLLSGSVSAASGKLEGVLIRATDVNSGAAVSVFSKANGAYVFPDNTLKPGTYRIDIRAAGYDLAAPIQVDVADGKTHTLPLQLTSVADPSQQWNNAEWLNAAPASGGAVDQRFVLNMCTHCHALDKVFRSTLDQPLLEATIARMGGYAVSSMPTHLQLRPQGGEKDELAMMTRITPGVQNLARYIASVNLSSGRSEFPFKPQFLPLPKGDATQVVIRSWTLPRKEAMPHDVVVDANGIVWYTDFGSAILGRLDPATGAIKEYEVPTLHANAPQGSLDIRFTADGAIWLSMLYQGGVARFDPRTEKFQTWSVPEANTSGAAQIAMVAAQHSDVDGKVWMVDASISGIHRVDLRSGAFETFKPFTHAAPTKGTGFPHTVYGIVSDAQNNVYFADWGDSQLGRIDARTGEITFFPTASAPARPRRLHLDEQGRVWYAAWQGNAIGYLDPKTGKVKEWRLPTPGSAPYDVTVDAFGNAWTAGMASDRVTRLSIRTGKVTEYLLPERDVNVRRVFVQNTKTGPVFWVGNNLGSSIMAVQPLD